MEVRRLETTSSFVMSSHSPLLCHARQVEYFITQNFPEFRGRIAKEMYPPGPIKSMIANICQVVWLGGILVLLTGSTICKTLKIEEPELFKTARENPFSTFIFLFIINSVGASQLSTGAFEVTLDGELIFSKLALGRVPQGPEILKAIESMGYTALMAPEMH
jgi:hypothetical protein